MSTFLQDLGYAVRLAGRRPGLTVVTVLTLALGIGGNSAVFSLINGLFLRPLPVERPAELVRVFNEQDGSRFDVSSFPNLSDIAAQSQTFASMAIHQQTASTYGLGDAAEAATIELVSGSYFPMLGVRTPMGRALGADDDIEGKPQAVAVISDTWWKTRLGGRDNVIGEAIHVNATPFTIVGVAPPAFRGSYDALGTDLWVPLMTYEIVRPRGLQITRRGWGWLSATARLRPAVSIEQAQADVDRIAASLRNDFPQQNGALELHLVKASAFLEEMGGTVQRVLLFALIVAALALAAACANVANVQLATVFERRREIAVRLALGASRGRIARQWLTESLLVAAVAAFVGTIGAMWVRDAASLFGPPEGLANFSPARDFDIRLVLFSTSVVAAVTMLFGGWPAIRAARVDVAGPLKEDTVTATGSARRAWGQAGLVAAQVAVSVALVMSSALLTRSLNAANAFALGFDSANLFIASPRTANLGMNAERNRAYYADTLARVRALPGVTDVTLGAVVPLGFDNESRSVAIDGYSPPDGKGTVSIANNIVLPNYFETLRIPVRRGRGFEASDGDRSAPVVAVVNETMSRRFWPDQNPVGRYLRIGNNPPVEVVGIVDDITYRAAGEAPRPFFYLPFGPVPYADGLSFHVRTEGRPDASLARSMRRELRVFEPRVQVPIAMPYDELRQQGLYPGRALAAVSTGFGAIALLLAIVGIYGVMTHVVASRRRELAVRLALGARPATLVAGVLRQGLRWSAAGIVAGLALAVGMAQLLKAFLFDVSTTDVLSLAGSAAVLIAVSLAAAYAPARRVLRIDPAATLRS